MTNSKRRSLKSLLLAATLLASPLITAAPTPVAAQAELAVSVEIAPPALPIYDQPPLPEEGYIWTPGYWYWVQDAGYFWVPGTWILPPALGLLWTPPYWAWAGGAFVFHAGYWGSHVGFYGGVNYGFGYGGNGYEGGRWNGNHFVYNEAANNFGSVHVAKTYRANLTVSNNTHVSYVGGSGGLKAEPTADERLAEHDRHIPATSEQAHNVNAAGATPELQASRNQGHPPVVATSHPAQFKGADVVSARPAEAGERAAAPAGAPNPSEHQVPKAAEATPEHPAEAHSAEEKPTAPAPHTAEVTPEHPVKAYPEEAAPAIPQLHPAEATPAKPEPRPTAPARPVQAHPEAPKPPVPEPHTAEAARPPEPHPPAAKPAPPPAAHEQPGEKTEEK